MKVSVQWLREMVAIGDMPVDKLAHALTMAGLEVEEITPVAGDFSRVVVGHVKSVVPHPNADRLKLTEVDAGTGGLLQIVCGAPNVAPGQKVPCALVGGRAGGMDITPRKMRGIESNGMLCSARELGLSQDHEGLLVLEGDPPVGADIRELLALDDVSLTLKLTPNRGDCLSLLGIARDVAAITGAELRIPAAPPVPTTVQDSRAVHIEAPEACGEYYGRVVRGLRADARTPLWMSRRIERAGLRPISPLVDITNYVMLERGQPMHAFDNAKLHGAIAVRWMRAGERVTLLNEAVVDYRPQLLAIADERGPVALGGVMGGHASMVGEGTTEVFFEAASFQPQAVQGKARELGLASDAAYRFERGVDPHGAGAAMERATALAIEICGGQAGPLTRAQGSRTERAGMLVRPARVRKLLGYEITDEAMHAILRRLACVPEDVPQGIRVTPPSWRFDLAIEEDFVEEIARIHGYEHVPGSAPRSSLPMLPLTEARRSRFQLRHALADLGYQEIISYSFVPEEWERDFAGNAQPVRVANPIASQMSVMRTTLLGGLVQALRQNLNRGESRARLFEVGRCFLGADADIAVQPERVAGLLYGSRWPEQWGEGGAAADFFDAKGDVEALAGHRALEFHAAAHAAFHPGRCARVMLEGRTVGFAGELHPRLQQQHELSQPAVAFELEVEVLLGGAFPRFGGMSRMPVVRRDLALVVADDVAAAALVEAARKGLPGFVRAVEVFDLYRGKGVEPGQKSLALRIVMQDTDRTLTDSDVEGVVSSIREQLLEKYKAKPRT